MKENAFYLKEKPINFKEDAVLFKEKLINIKEKAIHLKENAFYFKEHKKLGSGLASFLRQLGSCISCIAVVVCYHQQQMR